MHDTQAPLDAQWEGLLLTHEELAALICLGGIASLPGAVLPQLTDSMADDALQALQRRGLITSGNGRCTLDTPLRSILTAMTDAAHLVRLHGTEGTLTLYMHPTMLVLLHLPVRQRCRLLPLQDASNAFAHLEAYAEACNGHASLCVIRHGQESRRRLGPQWQHTLQQLRADLFSTPSNQG